MSPLPLTLSRSVLTILVPGIVAVAPWALAIAQLASTTLHYDDYSVLGNLVLFAAIVVAGSTCESLGSVLETRWDRSREAAFAVEENWYAYLARTFETEPVGYQYISRLVTTLYSSWPCSWPPWRSCRAAGCSARCVFQDTRWIWRGSDSGRCIGVSYLYWQAHSTHEVLCKTRRELNQRLGAR